MAVTLTDLLRTAELEPPYRPLGHARNSADWLTEEQVAIDQRRRLYGAMIELVAKRGYAAASTSELARMARMSKRDMYKRFPNKESYFLATYEMIVARAIERVGAAYAGEQDSQQRLRCAFQALAAEVVEQPKAARLALSEVFGAGQAGLERLEETRSVFETMVGASFRAPVLPPLIVAGIVRGVERIVRQRLLSGRAHELPALADGLLAWTLSYHSPALPELSVLQAPQTAAHARDLSRQRARELRIHLLRMSAQIAAGGGWEQLTPARIATHAEIPPHQVRELCGEDPRTCFLDALELLSTEALICAGQAARRTCDRTVGVHLGITALMQRLERDRTLCQLAFVEVFRLGPSAIPRREALLAKFAQTLTAAMPKDRRPAPLAAEATVGAIWGIVHHYVTHARTRQLPALALTGQLSYLALAPAVGAENAIHAIGRARQAPATQHLHAATVQPRSASRNREPLPAA